MPDLSLKTELRLGPLQLVLMVHAIFDSCEILARQELEPLKLLLEQLELAIFLLKLQDHVELLLTQAVLEPLLGVDILERVIIGL